jgi:hypothetical protein
MKTPLGGPSARKWALGDSQKKNFMYLKYRALPWWGWDTKYDTIA